MGGPWWQLECIYGLATGKSFRNDFTDKSTTFKVTNEKITTACLLSSQLSLILEHMLHLSVTQNQHSSKIHQPFSQEHIICHNNVIDFISSP